jgi:tetratricopeptide (TPR) repeat protein
MMNLKLPIAKLCFKKQIFFGLILIQSLTVFSQVPPEEFFKGLDLLNINKKEAKKEFLIAYKKDSLFHGTYHFLGVIYLADNQTDSAIYCFKKSIDLNKENINHTREMAYVRLLDTYLYQHDFNNSFSIAWEAYTQYPDNTSIKLGLNDVCLWSFYINHNSLDPSYLSQELKEEYVVNSVDEEYLIIRWVKINDQYLGVNSQSLIKKKRTSYDILKCTLSDSNETVDVKFKLNWDLDKYYGGRVTNTNEVYSNLDNPIYERIGALLVSDSKIDLDMEIKKLMK